MGKHLKGIGFWGGILATLVALLVPFLPADDAAAAIADWTKEQTFFNDVWQLVNRSYVDTTFNHQNWYKVRKKYSGRHFENREETYAAISEMLASLEDPFTRLLTPDRFRSMTTSTTGSLTGVGLQIAVDDATKSLVVISPIEGSPAAKAGLLSRDRIERIDGVPTQGMTVDECAERMRGDLGTSVTLAIARPHLDRDLKELGEFDRLEVTLTRNMITVNPVIARLNREGEHKVAYIRLTHFNGNAANDMKAAIQHLENDGADRYVLDLRGNPGGLLEAGIEIAREWLPSGPIVFTVDRHGVSESFSANGTSLTADPLVVLTDGGTASASEIVSGALQDLGRAAIVGTRTYGKGLVQSLFELEDGSGLAVTIARYETPNHRNINKVGIQPDRVVPLPHPLNRETLGTHDDPQYLAALQVFDAPVSLNHQKQPAIAG